MCLLLALLAACGTTPTDATSANPSTTASFTATHSPMNQKETAIAFVQAVTAQDTVQVRALATPEYVQHNPFLPTGREPFIALFPVLKEHGTQAQAVRALEDGNFVVLHHLWTGAEPFGAAEMVAFDLLRFDDEGQIAEHWDALMPNTPPNPSGRTLLDGATEVTDHAKTEAHRAQAKALFHTFIHGSQEEVVAVIQENFQPNYQQHSPTVADGIPAIFEAFGREQWVYQKHHKLIAEGNFVLSVSEGTAKGVPTVFYDLLRFEDGQVAEHWDVIQAIPSENLANENTMFGFE
jgi:predicted SnoaL-like aldol condensation-catalyzing enzyme